jgi:hypothetical protein
MKIVNGWYRHLEVQSSCPKCGKISNTDKGGGIMKDLKKTQGFWCDSEDCDQGVWSETVDWGKLINEYIG